jgi:hypothetical protein
MAFDPEETRRRLDELLARAAAAVPERPVDPNAVVERARRAIRLRYAVLTVSFVVLTLVLTGGAVLADSLRDDGGPTGPTDSGPTGGTATGPTDTTTEPPLPTVTIQTGPEKLTADPNAVFVFEIDPAAATPRCTLNQEPLPGCESGVPFEAAEGENVFEIEGVDDRGRAGESVTYTWTVDTTPPTIELLSVEIGFVRTSDDPPPGCFIDAEPRPCAGPIEVTPGEHRLEVDQPGTDSTWVLQQTPPTVSFAEISGSGVTSTITLTFRQDDPGTPECFVPDRPPIQCGEGVLTDTVTVTINGPATSRDLRIDPIDELDRHGPSTTFTWSFEFDTVE